LTSNILSFALKDKFNKRSGDLHSVYAPFCFRRFQIKNLSDFLLRSF
jgi:hypothetical protein